MISQNQIELNIPNFTKPKGLRRLKQYFNYAKQLEENITEQLEKERDELDKWRDKIYKLFTDTIQTIHFCCNQFKAPKHVAQIQQTTMLSDIQKRGRLPHTNKELLTWFLLCIYKVIINSTTTYEVKGITNLENCIKALIKYDDSKTSSGNQSNGPIKRADGTDQRHSPKQSRKSWFTRDSKKRPRDDSAAVPEKKRKSNDGKAIEVGNGKSQMKLKKQLLLKVPRHMKLCGEAINLVEEFLDKYEFNKSIIFDSTIVGYGSTKGSEVWEIWKKFSKIKDDDVRKEFPNFWKKNQGYLVVMTETSIPWDASCTQILTKINNMCVTIKNLLSKHNKFSETSQNIWEGLQKASDIFYTTNTVRELIEDSKFNTKIRFESSILFITNSIERIQQNFDLYGNLSSNDTPAAQTLNELNNLIPLGYRFMDWIYQFKDVQL